MSIHQGAQATPADAAVPQTPLLRTLGDADAAVCTDGYCEVPPRPQTAPESTATTEADE
jgi:hypothetical protein